MPQAVDQQNVCRREPVLAIQLVKVFAEELCCPLLQTLDAIRSLGIHAPHQRKILASHSECALASDQITGAVPSGGGDKCSGHGCGEYVAITCQR